ncbi:MAG: ATP-binding protein [Desulfosarcinaceae bacterium]
MVRLTLPGVCKRLNASLAFCLAIYLCALGGFAWWAHQLARANVLSRIDERLVRAAGSVKFLLAADFHDRAVSPDAIEAAEIDRNRMAVSGYVRENALADVYALVADNGRYYFSVPAGPSEKSSRYYLPYEEAPPGVVQAFEKGKPVFETFANEQGTFRRVAFPQTSPDGRPYLVCAAADISRIQSLASVDLAHSHLPLLVFAALVLPFVLFYIHDAPFRRRRCESAGQTEKQKARARADTAGTAKGEFLAKMSHEIRTPLNGIIGMTEAVLATSLNENQQRIMGIVVQESNHLLNIINNILDLSKIEAGKIEIEAVEFNLRRLMDEVGEGISLQASHNGLELNVYLSPELPERLVGDPTRLRQVLINLAGNALKFTRKGEVSIKGELAGRSDDGGLSVRFTVEDTGIGIPDNKKEAIFESFTQADGSTTRKYGGTGLGTTISRQLVGLMGGRLDLRSEAGKGTTMRFTLPFGLPEQETFPEKTATGKWNHLHVLVVDDCFTSRKIASKYLGAMGCRVSEACDGREALAAIKDGVREGDSFGLILTDYRMPNMNGYDLARHIRQMDGHGRTPIIAVTGLQEIVEIGNLQDLGFD